MNYVVACQNLCFSRFALIAAILVAGRSPAFGAGADNLRGAQTAAEINARLGRPALCFTRGPVALITGERGTSQVRLYGIDNETVIVMTGDGIVRYVSTDEVQKLVIPPFSGQRNVTPWRVNPSDLQLLEIARRGSGRFRSFRAKFGLIVNDEEIDRMYYPEKYRPKPKPPAPVVVEPPPKGEPHVLEPAPVEKPTPPPAPAPKAAPAPEPPPAPAEIPLWLKIAVGVGALAMILLFVTRR